MKQQLPSADLANQNETKEETSREIILWGPDDAEYLTEDDKDDAIYAVLEDAESPLPLETVTCGYARKILNLKEDHYEDRITEMLIESLDEEYGPIEESSEITNEMTALAKQFMKNFIPLYTSWQCDEVDRYVVNTKKWVTENYPDWITKNGVTFEEDE